MTSREEIETAADRHMERLRRRLSELAAEHGADPPAEADLTLDGLLEFLLGLGINPAEWLADVFSPPGSRIACRLESLALSLGEIGRSLRKVFELLDHRAATADEIRAGEALDQAARELVATVEGVVSAMSAEGTG